MFSWFGSSILSVMCRFLLLSISLSSFPCFFFDKLHDFIGYYYYYYSLLIFFFHTNVCWCFLIRFWVIASLLKALELLSVSCLILTMLFSGKSPLLLFPNLPVTFTNLFGTVPSAPISTGITVTFMFHFVLLQGLSTNFSIHFLLFWDSGPPVWQKPLTAVFFFFWWLSLDLIICLKRCDLYVSQNPREFCVSHSLGCSYPTCSYVQI